MIPSVNPSSVVDFAPPGRLLFHERFVEPAVADGWLDAARRLPWRGEEIVMFGKRIEAPRRTVSFGEHGASYRYSGVTRVAAGWGSFAAMRRAVDVAADARFNFVLGTHYASGRDSLGWHSDDERDLGDEPAIAVISLGVARDFQFRPKEVARSRRSSLAMARSL